MRPMSLQLIPSQLLIFVSTILMHDCAESNIHVSDVFSKFYVMDGLEKKISFSFKILLMRAFILTRNKHISHGLCLHQKFHTIIFESLVL